MQQGAEPGAIGQARPITGGQAVGEQRIELDGEILWFAVHSQRAQIVHDIARSEDQHAAIAQFG